MTFLQPKTAIYIFNIIHVYKHQQKNVFVFILMISLWIIPMNIHSTSLRDLNLKYFRSGGCELKSTAIVLDILHSCYHSIHSYCMEVHFTICNDNEVFFIFFFKLLTVQVTKSDPNQEPKEPKVHMVVQCVSKGRENWSAVHHMVLSFAQTTRLQAACDRKIASILALFMHHGKDEAEELHQQQYMVSNSLKTSTDLSARRVILVLP